MVVVLVVPGTVPGTVITGVVQVVHPKEVQVHSTRYSTGSTTGTDLVDLQSYY